MSGAGDLSELRAALTAAAGGDVEAMGEFVDPDFVLDDHTIPEDTTGRRGVPAMRAEFERLNQAFDGYRAELTELVDIGDSRLLAVLHTSGTGRGSGLEIDGDVGEILTLRDGVITRADIYPSPGEARQAAGIRP